MFREQRKLILKENQIDFDDINDRRNKWIVAEKKRKEVMPNRYLWKTIMVKSYQIIEVGSFGAKNREKKDAEAGNDWKTPLKGARRAYLASPALECNRGEFLFSRSQYLSAPIFNFHFSYRNFSAFPRVHSFHRYLEILILIKQKKKKHKNDWINN